MKPISSQPQVREPNSFGRRKESHSITITRNGRSRHYSVNPVYLGVLVGFVAMFSVGYFAATTYLVLRDDLISARGARDARMQHEYEDRIAALRTNLDRITSRQLLDQQAIETKVAKLIARQNRLNGNGSAMQAIVEKAKSLGLDSGKVKLDQTVTGSIKREKQASLMPSFGSDFSLRGVDEAQNLALQMETPLAERAVSDDITYRASSALFADVSRSIDRIDAEQKQTVDALRIAAVEKLVKVTALLKQIGASVPKGLVENVAIGGPFEPLGPQADFPTHIQALEHSLSALSLAREKMRALPTANPVPGKRLSSRFGSRIDPFKGTYAMHSGLDFKVRYGVPILAAGKGRVIIAKRNGGYGKMVEIRHANGLTTKYAHMSKILVKKGQMVEPGTVLGKVGSTGRSTGPHLHYEVRVNGKAADPQKYIDAGRKLASIF